jgi:hypothetical protein
MLVHRSNKNKVSPGKKEFTSFWSFMRTSFKSEMVFEVGLKG